MLRPTHIVVTSGQSVPHRLRLGTAAITIGRTPSLTIVVDDHYASMTHCRLTPAHGRWFIEDMGSTNGTYLDRAKIYAKTVVPKGVPIWVGATTFELR